MFMTQEILRSTYGLLGEEHEFSSWVFFLAFSVGILLIYLGDWMCLNIIAVVTRSEVYC